MPKLDEVRTAKSFAEYYIAGRKITDENVKQALREQAEVIDKYYILTPNMTK